MRKRRSKEASSRALEICQLAHTSLAHSKDRITFCYGWDCCHIRSFHNRTWSSGSWSVSPLVARVNYPSEETEHRAAKEEHHHLKYKNNEYSRRSKCRQQQQQQEPNSLPGTEKKKNLSTKRLREKSHRGRSLLRPRLVAWMVKYKKYFRAQRKNDREMKIVKENMWDMVNIFRKLNMWIINIPEEEKGHIINMASWSFVRTEEKRIHQEYPSNIPNVR